jgi:hypothetical protein
MRSRILVSGSLALLLMAVPALAKAQAKDPFPPDDSDLQTIIERANAYKAAANCAELECPKIDCAAAKAAADALNDLRIFLLNLVKALQAADHDLLAQYSALANANIADGQQLARTIWAIGVHEYLHNFGSALLSIASIASFAKDFATKPEAFEDLSPTEMLDRLNSWASGLRSLESLGNTLAKAQHAAPLGTPITGNLDIAGGVDTKSINDQISTINDVKKTINAALKNGKDWKKALKGGGAAALGQIAGRYLKLYSEDLLKERKAAEKELEDDIAASDPVLAEAFKNLRRVQARRFLAEDALNAVTDALNNYRACVAVVCGDWSYSPPVIPNFVEQVPQVGPKLSWGKALPWLNINIKDSLARITPAPVPFRNDCMRVTETFIVPVLPGSDTWCQYNPGSPYTFIPITPIPNDKRVENPPQPSNNDDGPPPPGGGWPTTDGGGTPTTDNGSNSSGGTTTDGGTPTTDNGSSSSGGTPTTDTGGGPPPPTIPLTIKATKTALEGGVGQAAVGHQQVKLFTNDVMNVPLPTDGAQKPQTGAGADPITCTIGDGDSCTVDIDPCHDFGHCGNTPAMPMEAQITPSAVTSFNLQVVPGTRLLEGLNPYVTDAVDIGEVHYVTVTAPMEKKNRLMPMIQEQPGLVGYEENFCRIKEQAAAPNDPYFNGKGAWGQDFDDQWALKRIGLTAGPDSAWNLLGPKPQPVTVAVIDTGLDWNHLDFDWRNLWRNPKEIPGNGKDDDGNGYVDDVIGWDFLANANTPWDHDGHGTLAAGIIAATTNNGLGIAGINPYARIMVLRALNAFGQTRASYIAKALVYAADNGARIVNLSVGGKNLTQIEKAAIAYARKKGVLIVVAAGNDGIATNDFGPAGAQGVLTVAATNRDDSHPAFSNWGLEIDLAAPGVDILSLRARRTDTVLGIPGVEYKAGSAYVGKDKRYYRAGGTSFAAPIVAGVASLVLSKRPTLSVDQLEAILINSAEDIQVPGRDQFSGAGLVNARRALSLDPSFSIEAAITKVEVVQLSGKPAVNVLGSARADAFAEAHLDIGPGENPTKFKTVVEKVPAVENGSLGAIPAEALRGSPHWTIRLVVKHRNGEMREARYVLDIGG